MAGFFDEQDRDDRKAYKRMVVYFVAAVSLAMLLFLIIIYNNTKEKNLKAINEKREEEARLNEKMEEMEKDEALGIGKNNLRSEDLDFWDMYEIDRDDLYDRDRNGDGEQSNVSGNSTRKSQKMRREYKEDNEDKIESANEVRIEDADHIFASDINGERQSIDILEDVPKNNYDFKGKLGVGVSGNELTYSDNKIKTRRGIDVSKYQGTIDWEKVRNAGIDFAMIRLGARGYGSGQLILDDLFVANVTGAKAAGIEVGVYFYTQAVTLDEAVEEANFTVGALINYGITYPVACDVEWVDDNKARTNDLSAAQRTNVVVKYLETVKSFGYKPMVYASRDMLLAGLKVDELTDYDVWLQDDYEEEDGTDYPYDFVMWQYTQKGKVDGINGDVDMNIYFTNIHEE